MNPEERMNGLEIKISHQDHLLEQLNGVIYSQQKQIDLLEKKLKELDKKIPVQIPANEKPPHY